MLEDEPSNDIVDLLASKKRSSVVSDQQKVAILTYANISSRKRKQERRRRVHSGSSRAACVYNMVCDSNTPYDAAPISCTSL